MTCQICTEVGMTRRSAEDRAGGNELQMHRDGDKQGGRRTVLRRLSASTSGGPLAAVWWGREAGENPRVSARMSCLFATGRWRATDIHGDYLGGSLWR